MQNGEELMSYMDTHAAFAPAGGIQELSFDEIEAVGGAGFFDWISRVTAGYRIILFGIEVSDGIPNQD
jgi:hypothetical protein